MSATDISTFDVEALIKNFDFEDDIDEEETEWPEMARQSMVSTADKAAKEQDVQKALDEVKEKSRRVQEENERRLKNERKKAALRRRKRVRCTPPGLKIFQPSYFKYFNRRNLDLERDFGYSERDVLRKQLSLTDQELDEVFRRPWKFLLFLSPELTSPLIRNEDDFAKICDFLFFTHITTRSELTECSSKKALFALLKNYAYSNWKLGLRHIVPAFLNLGMEESAVMNQASYDQFLHHRLEINKLTFNIQDVLPEFFKDRLRGQQKADTGLVDSCSESEYTDDLIECVKNMKVSYVDSGDEDGQEESSEVPIDYRWDPVKYDLVKRTVKVISDLICTFPFHCTAVPEKKSNNWLESLVTFYLLATVASDWHLITDSDIFSDVMIAFQIMLDGFSTSMWRGNVKEKDITNSISNDVTEALVFVGEFEDATNLRPWFDDEIPINLSKNDHHHNIVKRLQLLPPSYRGQVIKKMIAHYHLQAFLGVKESEMIVMPDVNAEDAWKLLDSHKNTFNSYADEHYVVMSIIRLVDALVGNEPFQDFKEETYNNYITKIRDFLAEFKSRKLHSLMAISEHNDELKVKELISLVIFKWGELEMVCKNGKREIMAEARSKKSKGLAISAK